MTPLVLVVALGVGLLACRVLAARTGVPSPVLQLVVGLLLGFVPVLRAVQLSPDVVLLLFLPALLYWECLRTGLRTARANARVIVLLSTALVTVTAGAVAAVGHALGLAWGPAWVLGAVVAPTDASAAAALLRGLPKRMVTTLRAESLVNDGTALVIYGVAVAATAGTSPVTPGQVAVDVAVSYLGGVASGLAVGLLSNLARQRLADPVSANLNSLVAPFAAYLVAESFHASGVLSVVACGLVALRQAPRFGRADGRRQRDAFWGLGTVVLNGALFCAIGLQAQSAVRALPSGEVVRGTVLAVVVGGVVIGVRTAWLFTTPYLLRAVDRRPEQRRRRMGARARLVYAVAGFRGAVSLAAALAVPRTTPGGLPFPDADLLVFVVAGVIVVTLGQALVLPTVIGWAQLPPDDSDARETALAASAMASESLEVLDRLAAELEVDAEVTERVRREVETQWRPDAERDPADHTAQYRRLGRAVLGRQRDVLLRLRDTGEVDDDVVAAVQSRLDLEEVRLR